MCVVVVVIVIAAVVENCCDLSDTRTFICALIDRLYSVCVLKFTLRCFRQ